MEQSIFCLTKNISLRPLVVIFNNALFGWLSKVLQIISHPFNKIYQKSWLILLQLVNLCWPHYVPNIVENKFENDRDQNNEWITMNQNTVTKLLMWASKHNLNSMMRLRLLLPAVVFVEDSEELFPKNAEPLNWYYSFDIF